MATSKSKTPEKLALGEMNDAQKIVALTEQNDDLRQIISDMGADGSFALYFAANRKNNEMARVLNNSKLSLEDNSIKNYQAMMKGMEETFAITIKLRNEYLKVDEKTAKEIESKGTPLIELRAENRQAEGSAT